MFFNSLLYELDKCNSSPLGLPNGKFISCLMYADDIIVFETSPEALQKLLDCVNTFCDKWNMTINPDKSKCTDILNKKQDAQWGIESVGHNGKDSNNNRSK